MNRGLRRKLCARRAASSPPSGVNSPDHVEARDDFGGARRPRAGIGAQQREDERVELLRNACDERARSRRVRVPQIGELLDLAGRIGVSLGKNPVSERPQSVKVGALVERRAFSASGGMAGGVPTTKRELPNETSAPKSISLQCPSGSHPHVGRTNVPMD